MFKRYFFLPHQLHEINQSGTRLNVKKLALARLMILVKQILTPNHTTNRLVSEICLVH